MVTNDNRSQVLNGLLAESKRKRYKVMIQNLEQTQRELSRTAYTVYELGGLSDIEKKISQLKAELALLKKGDK